MSTEQRRLGRGLGSLLGSSAATPVGVNEGATEISLDRIVPNARQPRKHFDPVHMEEL